MVTSLRTLYSNDERFDLTDAQVNDIWSRGLTLVHVQDRLDEGWGLAEAIQLSKNYYMNNGDICLRYQDDVRTLYIPIYVVELIGMEYNDTKQLFHNLSMGKSLKNAVSNIQGGIFDRNLSRELEAVDETEIMHDRQIARIRSLARQNKRKRTAKAERQKLRDEERKPHLYNGTPQHHTYGKYAQYLEDSYTFKCSEVSR